MTDEIKPIILKEGHYSERDVADLKEQSVSTIDLFIKQSEEFFNIQNPKLVESNQLENEKNNYIAKLEKNPSGLGDWVFFSWNKTLVHMLNERQYYLLRTNRNKNLITEKEQKKLYNSCVGVAGLSVGNNIAVGLQYLGASGNTKLAEYDDIETSNLNRMRASILDMSQSKIDVTAKQIYEVNPYARLYRYPKLKENNLESFFSENKKLDVVFDEIDDFAMKINIRIMAKKHKVPVIMMTNLGDKVVVDIERYDLDDELEIFNGLIGNLKNEILNKDTISEEEKKKYAVQLIGIENVPKEAIDSVKEIGKTLVGRPQLFSTVAISGGLAVYLTKNLLLGKRIPSGRKVFELESSVPI